MPKWTPEQARENAKKGGQAAAAKRAERAAMKPEERAKAKIIDNIEALTERLIDASLGQGSFAARVEVVEFFNKKKGTDGEIDYKSVIVEGLTASEQLGALKTALAYGLGRPPTATVGRPPEPDKPTEPTGGLAVT